MWIQRMARMFNTEGAGGGAAGATVELTEEQVDKMSPDQLAREYEKPGASHEQKSDQAAEQKPTEPKLLEVTMDDKSGEAVLVYDDQLTEKERIEAAAAAAAGAMKPDAPVEDGAKLEEGMTALQAQFDVLAKQYPGLAKLVPEGEGLKGMLTRFNALSARVGEVQRREEEALEAERAGETVRSQEAVQKYIDMETMQRLGARAAELKVNITDVPKTEEDWDRLWDDNPGKARRIEKALDAVRGEVTQYVVNVQRAAEGMQSHNSTEINKTWDEVQKFAKTTGLTITEDQFVEFARKHVGNPRKGEISNPMIYEMRHGIPYLREQALLNTWKLENQEAILQAVRAATGTTTRRQTVEQLAKNGPSTTILGATGIGQTRGKREVRIDPTNERQLDNLTVEQLEQLFYKT